MPVPRLSVLFLVCAVCLPSSVGAQVFDEQFDHWPVDHRIRGRVLLSAGSPDPKLLRAALPREQLTGGLLIVDTKLSDDIVAGYQSLYAKPVATQQPNSTPDESEPSDTPQESSSPANSAKDASPELSERLVVLRTDAADEMARALSSSRAPLVIWHTAEPLTADRRADLLRHAHAFAAVINRGATLAVFGPNCGLAGRYFAADHAGGAEPAAGLNLLPDTIVHANFVPEDQPVLLSQLAVKPRCVGVGLSADALLELSGRVLHVVGSGSAAFLLMANERLPIRKQIIAAPRSRRESPSRWLVDLTEWRRDAIDRTLPVFPPAKPPTPHVDNGTLVIVGGGGMPNGLMERIVELAGGKDEARMVYIPCSSAWDVSERQRTVEAWQRMGVRHATFIHTKDRNRANSDEEILAPLREATGLWFGGGRQWNFSDSYYGTKAHQLMKDVLRRGGVIGGSSAGASIQARYLARATPIENFRIMAPGYERGGLGFIGGVAIDQHFSQRRRQKDMTQLVNRYPQMLGIGIDEATALVVQKSTAEIVGRGRVHFYNRELPVYPDKPDFIALPVGSKYDLAKREVLVDGSKEAGDADKTNETEKNAP